LFNESSNPGNWGTSLVLVRRDCSPPCRDTGFLLGNKGICNYCSVLQREIIHPMLLGQGTDNNERAEESPAVRPFSVLTFN